MFTTYKEVLFPPRAQPYTFKVTRSLMQTLFPPAVTCSRYLWYIFLQLLPAGVVAVWGCGGDGRRLRWAMGPKPGKRGRVEAKCGGGTDEVDWAQWRNAITKSGRFSYESSWDYRVTKEKVTKDMRSARDANGVTRDIVKM